MKVHDLLPISETFPCPLASAGDVLVSVMLLMIELQNILSHWFRRMARSKITGSKFVWVHSWQIRIQSVHKYERTDHSFVADWNKMDQKDTEAEAIPTGECWTQDVLETCANVPRWDDSLHRQNLWWLTLKMPKSLASLKSYGKASKSLLRATPVLPMLSRLSLKVKSANAMNANLWRLATHKSAPDAAGKRGREAEDCGQPSDFVGTIEVSGCGRGR